MVWTHVSNILSFYLYLSVSLSLSLCVCVCVCTYLNFHLVREWYANCSYPPATHSPRHNTTGKKLMGLVQQATKTRMKISHRSPQKDSALFLIPSSSRAQLFQLLGSCPPFRLLPAPPDSSWLLIFRLLTLPMGENSSCSASTPRPSTSPLSPPRSTPF